MAPIINRGLPRILRSGYVTTMQAEPNRCARALVRERASGRCAGAQVQCAGAQVHQVAEASQMVEVGHGNHAAATA